MDVILPTSIFLFGLVGGMIVNYVSDVLPHTRRLSGPHCWNCSQSQNWGNYFVWPRQCSHCGKRRKWRVWVVEVIFVSTAFWIWNSPPLDLGPIVGFVILVYFGAVVVIDIEHRVIMHPISLAGVFLAGAVGINLHGFSATLIGGVAGFGILLVLYYFGDYFARWLARRREQEFDDVALGFGDVNLAGVLGLLMGWPGITLGLVLGVLAGGVFSLFYIIFKLISRKYSAFSTIPYGPFLIFGAVVLLYFKEYFQS